MSQLTTPNLALVKAVTGSNEPWSNDILNGNWDKLDAAIGARTSKFTLTTVSNLNTEQTLFSVPIPANPSQGASYTMKLFGTYDNSASATSYTIRVKIGGTQVTAITKNTPASLQTFVPWRAEFDLVVLTTGPTGTWFGSLLWSQSPSAGNTTEAIVPGAATTRDTTGINNMEITVQWAAAASGNTFRANAGMYNRMV